MIIHLGNSSLWGKHTTTTDENGILQFFDIFQSISGPPNTKAQEKINNGVHFDH